MSYTSQDRKNDLIYIPIIRGYSARTITKWHHLYEYIRIVRLITSGNAQLL
ncbi:5080_t:CDS:2 [Funneliformis mosseae]|uniref:5080_t:CDS:1 n=1 Tax=Funneliformis mosseae TaxID=27381 RepID=A0A9N9D550_FUNMO|nr:5080_t:CDS:2 [Funneliformis mosseae]